MATFTGTNGNDTITPTTVDPTVTATPSGAKPTDDPDSIDGGYGNDTIDGGGGSDTIRGGAGVAVPVTIVSTVVTATIPSWSMALVRGSIPTPTQVAVALISSKPRLMERILA